MMGARSACEGAVDGSPASKPRVDDGRPFRGSDAVRAGRVTRGVLTGPGFRRAGSDTYVAAGVRDDAPTRLQHEVFDEHRFVARLDMAWVEFQVLRRPEWVVARVREALLARGWAPSVRAS